MSKTFINNYLSHLFFLWSWPSACQPSRRPSLGCRNCSETSGCIPWSWALLWRAQVGIRHRINILTILRSMLCIVNLFEHVGVGTFKSVYSFIFLSMCVCRFVARGVVRGSVWDCYQVPPAYFSERRTSTLWATVQLCPKEWHCHSGTDSHTHYPCWC